MSTIALSTEFWKFNRGRTLALLKSIEDSPDPQSILGWRPGPGRAHIAWQLMHIGITEERFALMKPVANSTITPQLIDRFRGGSVPDDEIPSIAEIRRILEESRAHLLETMSHYSDADLESIPERFQDRGWTFDTVLKVLAWHEPHHQGQAHITLNLWKAAQT
ncbi:MAG: DinB family protein [Planctomycetaceae bacterium]|nr:DinB family protein [Planctomycetaceae bacterium]